MMSRCTISPSYIVSMLADYGENQFPEHVTPRQVHEPSQIVAAPAVFQVAKWPSKFKTWSVCLSEFLTSLY